MRYFLASFLAILLVLGVVNFVPNFRAPSQKIVQKTQQTIVKIEEIKETIAPQPTRIQSDGLPDKHLINTAFVPQAPEKNWDEPWQDACEEAALLTVDYYYRSQSPSTTDIKNDILSMIDYEHSQGWYSDINVSQMSKIAQDKLKYSTKILTDPTIEDFKKYLSQNIPVIVPANGKILYRENQHFKDGGPYYHNIVVLGYDDAKKQFIVHDVGTQFGANYHYSYSLLIESIHDFPDTLNKADINKGSKLALIMLK